ncbi:hypothetical protein HNQ95_004684 [Aminobacter ciceronei]|jgi:hypothetical protein|uniref:Uncharacterized protein n=1 Tax=Aminobacter ciceronei TaxID=150723 RepID=A0ABR6CCL5_9HYPH|nr:hypothetical protein [Aminobacter ciceronei]MBA9022631.1 hypothetical protein [Aminobacter ciceronei]
MRVLVCGGRGWCDILAMMTVMDELNDAHGPSRRIFFPTISLEPEKTRSTLRNPWPPGTLSHFIRPERESTSTSPNSWIRSVG